MSAPRRHCDWSDSVAAYLLDALPDDERAAFEAHLPECDACRVQLAELAPSVAMLATSAPRVEPPDRLRSTLLAKVASEAELVREAGPQAAAQRRRSRWRRPVRLSPAWAGIAAALLLLVGGAAGALLARGGDEGTRIITARVAPGVGSGARAELMVGRDLANLRLRGMPPPPAGKVYQVWLTVPGAAEPQPTDVLFSVPTDGTTTVAVPTPPGGVRQVLVTAEPEGGSTHPTSEPILAAQVS
jgi:hypothetical protein